MSIDENGKLTLDVEPGTTIGDGDRISRFHFYTSSVVREDTGFAVEDGEGEKLLSMSSRRAGMRLTPDQVIELRDFLDAWLGVNGPLA